MAKNTNDALLAVGDIHAPFHDVQVLAIVLDVIQELQPRYIAQVGDVYDLYNFSRFKKSLNLIGPQVEVDQAKETARLFWAEAKKRSPASRRYQLLGNHDDRLKDRLLEKAPEFEDLVRFREEYFTFPGVETLKTSRDVLELTVQGERWMAHHGFKKRGEHVKHFHANVITGHSHSGHVMPHKIHDKLLWDVNCGYAALPNAPVFDYKKTVIESWTRGYAVVDSLGPRFVSLERA